MAVTIAIVKRTITGNARRVIFDVTGPASYTTGGEAVTAAQCALLFPEIAANKGTADLTPAVFFDAEVSGTTTPAFLSCVLDRTNTKMLYTTAGAQTTSTTNLSAQVIRCSVVYGGVTG